MGIVTNVLGAPVTGPAKGVFWILKKVYEAAYDEFYDPSSIKRQLIELEDQLDAGHITEEEFEEVEVVLLQRLKEAARAKAEGQ